jgi:hypothetical protein
METTPMSYTTTNSTETLIEMFIDGTPNEVYNNGRLATVPTENGVQLVAYGHEIIAEVQGKRVIIYTGHHETVSDTVTGYIKDLGSILNTFENRKVQARKNESPTLGIGTRASHSAKYISAYINWHTTLSSVEQKARKEVNNALKSRMADIFGA